MLPNRTILVTLARKYGSVLTICTRLRNRARAISAVARVTRSAAVADGGHAGGEIVAMGVPEEVAQ